MNYRFRIALGALLLIAISILGYSIYRDFPATLETYFRISPASLLFFRITIALLCALLIAAQSNRSEKSVPAIILFLFVFMLFIKWTQHLSFNTHSHDVGLFHSALWNSIHGNWMFDSVRGQFYLADHLIFFLFLLVPFYWVYSGPETLFVLSALAFALAAFGIYKLTEERLRSKIAALLMLIAFATNRYIWGAFLHEFHPDFFAPLFFFLLFFSYYKKTPLLFLVSLICILSLKEDYAIYLIPTGLYFLIQKEWKIMGLITILTSAIYFAVAYYWILPNFIKGSDNYSYINSWAHLGSGPVDIMRNLFLNPANLFGSMSYKTVGTFFTKFIFLPFLSPTALLFLFPPVLLYTSAQFELIRGLSIHYGLIPATFGFIAAVEGLRNLNKIKNQPHLVSFMISILCVVGLFRFTFYIPFSEAYELQLRKKEFSEMRPLCVQSSVFPHLIPSGQFSIFPECASDAQYVSLFLRGDPYPVSKDELRNWILTAPGKKEWRLVENSSGLVLFKRENS